MLCAHAFPTLGLSCSRSSLAGILVAPFGLIWLSDGETEVIETPSELSVEEVYRRAGETLRGTGGLLRLDIDTRGDSRIPYRSEQRLWVDPARDLAREEVTMTLEAPDGSRPTLSHAAIHTAEATMRVEHDHSSRTQARTCYGADLATSVVLGCSGVLEESTTRVANGAHEGEPAVVLITEGTTRDSDSSFTMSRRLYLDAETYLPLALVGAGTMGEVKTTFERRTYRLEWLDEGALAADHFEVASIGYAPRDPEEGIRGATDLQVYWLGREFEAPGVEKLVLVSSVAAPGRGAPYRYSLTYRREADPFNPPSLTLYIFFPDMWAASPAIESDAVTLDDAVVFFSESRSEGGDSLLTPEALETLKRSLMPYEP